MTSLPPSPAESEAEYPSDKARRVSMTLRLLRSAVRHYLQTLAFAREVDGHIPDAFKSYSRKSRSGEAESPSLARKRLLWEVDDSPPEGEKAGWLMLRYEADSAFYSAEIELATRIVNLYDFLAPEDLRLGPEDDWAEYRERGVTLDGRTFIVLYDPAQYEAGDVIISMTPIEHVIGLDG